MASRFTLTGISRLYYAKIQTPCRGSIGVSEHSSEAAQHSTHSLPESHSTGLGTIQQRTWKSSQTSVGEDKVLKKSQRPRRSVTFDLFRYFRVFGILAFF